MGTIKDKSILLVDDEPAILLMCQSILKENGFTNILTADTSLRALERLDTRPDLAVLDVMLPDMDGFMLAKVIREQTNIPILFLTAKGEFDDKAKGFEVGADDYIVKPFLAQEFVWRVTAILRRVYKENEDTSFLLEACKVDLGQAQVYKEGCDPVSLTAKEVEHGGEGLLDPNNLICVSHDTHNAIHFGDSRLLRKDYVERKPGDTALW